MKALFHLLRARFSDWDERKPLPAGFIDDASRLNQTRIAEIVTPSHSGGSVEDQLRRHVQHARDKKLPLSIAGTRHTMGGQTFTPGGMVLNMLDLRQMHLDEQNNVLHVQAGACWSDVLCYLHERHRSPLVMQASNSFSVGGSLGANCHGWQPASPPIASTVVAFRLLLADGTILRCSREENAELFSLVLGGYGLLGIVIDVELATCVNVCYRATSTVLPSAEYVAFYQEYIRSDSQIGLAYGRFNVDPEHFLRDILLSTYSATEGNTRSPLRKPGFAGIRRAIFRGSAGSAANKARRWKLEKQFGTLAVGQTTMRNVLLNDGVEVFQGRRATHTDILHEYFIPAVQLEPFLERLRIIVPTYGAELLNVTIRFVCADHVSFLRYADQDMFALVMLFHQPRTWQADQDMVAMTREIIDAVLQSGGRYYLPYRLHATLEQFSRAYPQARQFFALKRKYDPGEVFQNELYRKYRVVESTVQ